MVEVIPPAVDSELNYEGRVKRNFLKTGVTAEEFAAAVMEGFEKGENEDCLRPLHSSPLRFQRAD